MRRAIVHIGLPRTGTTTLQRILSRLRPELDAAGILYPELQPRSADVPHLNHQYLGEALDGRRSAEERTELLGQLAEQVRATRADVVLLSYESLCLIPARRRAPEHLWRVLNAHGFAMETVLTLKHQGEYLNSTYTWRTQFLREGRTFPTFLRAEMGGAQLDLLRLVRPWLAVSGGFHAVPVRDARSGQPLVERFLAELGLLERVGPLVTEADARLVENRSPGPVAVEICRRLQRNGAHLALGRRIREATRFVEAAVQEAGLDAVPFRGMDATAQARVDARWARANERFAEVAWGAPWAACVAATPARGANELAGHAVDAETRAQVEAIGRRVLEQFGVRPRSRWFVLARDLAAVPAGLLRRVGLR